MKKITTNTTGVKVTTNPMGKPINKPGTDNSAPTIPTNLIVSSITTNSLILSWTASIDANPITYDVFKNNVYLKSTSTVSTSISGLSQNTTYSFKVRARDNKGNVSDFSTPVVALTDGPPPQDLTPPTNPTSLVASNITGSTVDLSWNASTDNVGVTGYEVFKNTIYYSTVLTTNTQITGLEDATAYTFLVRAKDANNNYSTFSNQVNITTLDITPPSAPVLTGTPQLDGSIYLVWTFSTDNVTVTEYEIYKDTLLLDTVATNNYLVTGLTPETLYSFYVKAKDGAGNNTDSNTVNVTTTGSVPTENLLTIQYDLPTNANVSIGLFDDNDVLVRTLISAESQVAGSHTKTFKLVDDLGNTISNVSNLHGEVIYSNVDYEWEGGRVGNSSEALTGNTKYYGIATPTAIESVGQYLYVANGYSEGTNYMSKAHIDSPNIKIPLLTTSAGTNAVVVGMSSDSNTVYACGTDPFAHSGYKPANERESSYVFGVGVASDVYQTFLNGVPYKNALGTPQISSVIDLVSTDPLSSPKDVAVQKNGNLLAVSRGYKLHILDKQGGLIKANTLNCDGVIFDNSNNLWVATGGTDNTRILYEELFEGPSPLSTYVTKDTSTLYGITTGSYVGKNCARIEINYTDPTKRAQIVTPKQTHSKRMYHFSIYVPSSEFLEDNDDDILCEWVQDDNLPASLTLCLRTVTEIVNNVSTKRLRFVAKRRDINGNTGEFIFASNQSSYFITRDVWQNFTFEVNFVTSSASIKMYDSSVNVSGYMNWSGTLAYPINTYGQPKWKIGIRKSTWETSPTNTTKRVIYIDDIRIGDEVAQESNLRQYNVLATTVKKYAVSPAGILTELLSISGFQDIKSLGITPGNNYLLVTDAGNSQQVKAFNSSTGNIVWTLGQQGGYQSNSFAYEDKFYFSDLRSRYGVASSVTVQEDGKIWVLDGGNCRIQRFLHTGVFDTAIYVAGGTYAVYTSQLEPNKVYSNFKEYEIDYNQPFTGSTGWKLKANWGAILTNVDADGNGKTGLKPVKLSNNKTYTLVRLRIPPLPNQSVEFYELTSTGTLRGTGVYVNSTSYTLADDGYLYQVPGRELGTIKNFTRQAITFDANSNPILGSPQIIASTPPTIDLYPKYTGDIEPKGGQITDSGKITIYQSSSSNDFTYHLGAVKLGESTWSFLTSRANYLSYEGQFPIGPYFEIGNGTNYPGGQHFVRGNNIYTGHHGEFWKNSQTNRWQHYDESGLLIGTFGTDAFLTRGQVAAAEMAGNAFNGGVVEVGGNHYLYHGDESRHGAVHRWKISNLSSINKMTVPVSIVPYEIDEDIVDLMEGSTYGASTLPTGWSMSPASNILIDKNSDWWKVGQGKKEYDFLSPADIFIEFRSNAATSRTVIRDLGTIDKENWTISAKLNIEGNYFNRQSSSSELISGGGIFIDLLDITGKIIIRNLFYYNSVAKTASIISNNTVLGTYTYPVNLVSAATESIFSGFMDYEVSLGAGLLSHKIYTIPYQVLSPFDGTCDLTKPKSLRFLFFTRNEIANRMISVKDIQMDLNPPV